MENQLRKDGQLELVWLAGNGQFAKTTKGRKSKLYKSITMANVVNFCGLVRGLIEVTTPYRSKDIGLKKISILITGVTIIHEMKVDQLLKLAERLYTKLTLKRGLSGIDLFEDGNRKAATKGPCAAVDVQTNISVTFGEFDLPDYFGLQGADLQIHQGPGALVRTIDPSYAQMEIEDKDDLRTRNRRGPTSKRKPEASSREGKSLRSTDREVLELLRNVAANLNPRAHTMIEIDLPQLPPPSTADGMEFEENWPIESFVEELGRENIQRTIEIGSNRPSHVVHMTPPHDPGPDVILPPVRPHLDRVTEQIVEDSFEIDPNVIAENNTIERSRRYRRKLKYQDEVIQLNNLQMRKQCSVVMDDKTKTGLQWSQKARLIKDFSRNQVSPNKQEIRINQHGLTKGLNFISGSGRLIPSRELSEMLDTIKHISKVIPLESTRIKLERECRKNIQASELEPEVQHGRPNSLTFQFMEEEIPTCVPIDMDIPVVGNENIKNFSPPTVVPKVINLEFDQDRHSQSPIPFEQRHSFQDLIPPGKPRREACRMFLSLLNLQGKKLISLEQTEPFGEIYINRLRGIEDDKEN